jgi:hypothetical protein
MNVKEICKEVRKLCEDERLQFFFAVPEMSEWSVANCKHLQKLVDYHKELETSKQEPMLDKIRAEIKSKIVKRPWLDFEDRERDRNDAFLEVLDIIDKYKAESEEEE